jgi:hypothetical protein
MGMTVRKRQYDRFIAAHFFIVCLVICLRVQLSYGAQSSITTGTLLGVVRDASGAVILGADVSARNVDTNQTRESVSASDGEYRIAALPVGDYEVRVVKEGFAPYVNPSVTVVLGQAGTLDIALDVAAAAESVAVHTQPSIIDVTATATTTTIDGERIEELPVNSRNYLEFTLLAPGVAPSSPSSSSGGNGSATPLTDSGFTFGGMRPRSNSISIDGLDNTDETTGAARVALSPEIVREFQIVNNGLSAESGGAAGGAINIVTKTGSNDIHGDAFLFAQNELFNADDPVAARAGSGRPLFHRYQSGFALGGPLQRDKLFFYMAGEQEHASQEDASEISALVGNRISAALASGFASALPVRSLQSGRFATSADETEAAGKLTYLYGRHSMNSRFAFTNARVRGIAFNTEELDDLSSRGSSYIKDYQLTGSDLIALSSTSINELRFQLASRRAVSHAGDRIGPEVDIAGVAMFGRPYGSETARRENRMQILDNITVERGRHEWKAGVSGNVVGLNAQMQDGFGGLFTFLSVDDFMAGRPAAWRQTFGRADTSFNVGSLGGFVQDTYQLSGALTLNLDLRYAVERLPRSFATDFRNVSPRMGIAWAPSKPWIVRGSFGIYHDRIPLAFVDKAVRENGTSAFEQIADESGIASAVFNGSGGHPFSPVPGIAPSIFSAAPTFSTPYSIQSNASVERQISTDVSVRASYLFSRGRHLLRTRNANLLPPVLQPDGRELFSAGRIDSRYGAIYQLESSASSDYNGLTLSLNKRLSDEFELLASYTWSKTLDDASDYNEQPQNPYNLLAERGPSRQDMRNRVAISSLFDLPIGPDEEDVSKPPAPPNLWDRIFGHIEAAPIASFGSGRPFNAATGADEEQSLAYPYASRPLLYGRNAFRTPSTFNVDLRVVKYIPFGGVRRLDFVAEAFNLLNHSNVVGVNSVYGTNSAPRPSFRTATSFLPPRQLRFSIDFEF